MEESEKKEEGEKTEEVKEVKAEEKKDEKEVEITEENINIVIEQAHCTREKAIETLKQFDNDAVNAIMELTG